MNLERIAEVKPKPREKIGDKDFTDALTYGVLAPTVVDSRWMEIPDATKLPLKI